MPTLDDLPTLATNSTPTGDDLLPVYDLTATGSSKVRKLPLNQINGLSATDVVTDTDAGNITIASRVLVISGGSTSALTLPAASGALRELFVINDASGTATLPTLAAGNELVTTGTSAHLLSNGTGWYRVS
jgi:hypothetical protein